jgi:flagellar export protein FliJ
VGDSQSCQQNEQFLPLSFDKEDMKRFHFRLERVLSVKKQREKLAEMRQQQARAQWEEAKAECTRLEEELLRNAVESAARLRQAAALGTWQAHYERAAMLEQSLRVAQRRADEAEARLQEANRLRIQASLEVEALLTLRTREWETYRRDAERRRQNDLDEVGMQRWLARRAANPFAVVEGSEGDEV